MNPPEDEPSPHSSRSANILIPDSKILKCMTNHVKKNKKILQHLDKVLTDFQSYDQKRFGAKFTGTTASMVGAAGLALAPFTAGSSLALTWIGGVGLSAGIAINGATEIVNYYENKMALDKITQLFVDHDSYINEYQEVLTSLMKYAKLIAVRENLTNDQAIGKAFYEHINGRITCQDNNTNSVIAPPTDTLAVIPKPSQQTKAGIKCSVLISSGEVVGGTATQVASRGVTLTAAKTAGQVVKYGGVGLSGIFVVIDFCLLVKDWMSNHPTIAKILEIKAKLNEEIAKLEKNIEIIRRYEAEGRTLRVGNLEELVQQQRIDLDASNRRIQQLQFVHRQQIEEISKRMGALEASCNQ